MVSGCTSLGTAIDEQIEHGPQSNSFTAVQTSNATCAFDDRDLIFYQCFKHAIEGVDRLSQSNNNEDSSSIEPPT